MRVQKYQEERVLKSAENSEAVENGALDLIKMTMMIMMFQLMKTRC